MWPPSSRTTRRSGPPRPRRAPPRPSVERLEDRLVPDGSFGPWGTPVNLDPDVLHPVVNSPSGELRPGVSKDGLSLYFSSNRPGGQGGEDLWVSQRASTDGPWGAPVNLGSILNSSGDESAPSFSRDGHWLLFHSTGLGGFGDADIWISYRTNIHDDFGWQAPVNLGPGVNSAYTDAGPTLFEDEETGITTLYFNSTRPGGPGGFDIYASTLGADGTFGPAVLVPELSSPARDTRMALRHDGREIIIASDRPGGQGGIDLWVSTRETTLDPWSAPVNLGPVVNTAFTDGAATISSDGQTLFFYSNRPGGVGGNDLYMTTRSKARGFHGGGETLPPEGPAHRPGGDVAPLLAGRIEVALLAGPSPQVVVAAGVAGVELARLGAPSSQPAPVAGVPPGDVGLPLPEAARLPGAEGAGVVSARSGAQLPKRSTRSLDALFADPDEGLFSGVPGDDPGATWVG
jgi:hypothetical protein